MGKQLIGIIIILLLVGAVFYIWWQDQKDVIKLNRGLPEGIRVTESFIGNEYRMINKIDGYAFKVPKEWEGVSEIIYTPERTESGYTGASVEIEGEEGAGRIVSVDRFKMRQLEYDLKTWAEDFLKTFDLVSALDEDNIGGSNVVKTREKIGIIGYLYFLNKNSAIYVLSGGSEEFIREIISNGEW